MSIRDTWVKIYGCGIFGSKIDGIRDKRISCCQFLKELGTEQCQRHKKRENDLQMHSLYFLFCQILILLENRVQDIVNKPKLHSALIGFAAVVLGRGFVSDIFLMREFRRRNYLKLMSLC